MYPGLTLSSLIVWLAKGVEHFFMASEGAHARDCEWRTRPKMLPWGSEKWIWSSYLRVSYRGFESWNCCLHEVSEEAIVLKQQCRNWDPTCIEKKACLQLNCRMKFALRSFASPAKDILRKTTSQGQHIGMAPFTTIGEAPAHTTLPTSCQTSQYSYHNDCAIEPSTSY